MPLRTRYLLKVASGWLADHSLVSDASQVSTAAQSDALCFASVDAALARARLLTDLFPEITVDAVPVDFPLGQSLMRRRG